MHHPVRDGAFAAGIFFGVICGGAGAWWLNDRIQRWRRSRRLRDRLD